MKIEKKSVKKIRCPWAEASKSGNPDPLVIYYHDNRWCKEVHNDNELFALMVLESFSVGLSWALILNREDGMRALCDNFIPEKNALYDEEKETELMKEAAMIRHRGKIKSIAQNAKAFLKVKEEFGSFDKYIWSFTDGKIIDNRLKADEEMPAVSELSVSVSKDLKKRGFKFLGSVIVYSYLQAIGVINDHLLCCEFR